MYSSATRSASADYLQSNLIHGMFFPQTIFFTVSIIDMYVIINSFPLSEIDFVRYFSDNLKKTNYVLAHSTKHHALYKKNENHLPRIY